jgi:hypothetical protein
VATTTSTPETSVVEIPFLIRGRVVQPDDDGVEFGGRVGARFRIPDPAKFADQLVLADAGDLRDLRETPVDQIIDFLAELGPLLTLDENPLLQAAYELALEAGELTESVLAPVYDEFPLWFERDRLERMIEGTVGKAYLDGWVRQGALGRSSVSMRAIGTRQLHIIAGNVPITTAITVVRSALTKGDCLIKMPSNDPYTATAVVQSMIDLAPDHPVTKHFAVAYWKGGDEAVEQRIIRPQRIEKLTAWGGMASMKHIQKYLVPGIELIAFNPKWSISIVGHQALESTGAMKEAAHGVAVRAGEWNQTGCSCTRVVYVECATDEDDLERLEQFGRAVYEAFGTLPASFSTAPKRSDRELDAELEAIAIDEEFYRVIGDTSFGGVVVSRTDEPVDFSGQLNNRIVNLVPVSDITRVGRWVHGDETQTIGVYPSRLREQLRSDLATYGAQRIVPLVTEPDRTNHEPAGVDPDQRRRGIHDGHEPLRRMVRWVTEESAELR